MGQGRRVLLFFPFLFRSFLFLKNSPLYEHEVEYLLVSCAIQYPKYEVTYLLSDLVTLPLLHGDQVPT